MSVITVTDAELHRIKHGAVLLQFVQRFVFDPTVWFQDEQNNLWTLLSVFALTV